MRLILPIVLCMFTFLCNAETFSFAFVPQQSAKKLVKKWQPVLDYLSIKTGDKYIFATAKNIPTFEMRLANEEYDFAYMNPYHFTVFNQVPGYQALSKQKNKKIKGIIVVHRDSKIKDLTDMEGDMVVFPAPAAFAATLLTRAEFSKRNIHIIPKFVSSHDSVYLNVAREMFPAGGGVLRTLGNTNGELKQQLRVLWTTQGYTPHAIAHRKGINKDAVKRLQDALLAMDNSETGLKLLKNVNFNGFERAENQDWDDVRSLDIKKPTGF